MDNGVELMDGKEYLSVVSPIIEPLKEFERIWDSVENEKRIVSKRVGSENTTAVVAPIFFPLIFVIIFFILNILSFFYSGVVRLGAVIVYAGSFFMFFIYYEKRKKSRIEKIREESEHRVADMNTHLEKIGGSIGSVLNRYVPTDYQSSFALSYICNYLSNGRASNLQAAMNVFEEECHRMRIENIQQELLKQSKYQTAFAAVSAVANVSTAFSAASAASSLEDINAKL